MVGKGERLSIYDLVPEPSAEPLIPEEEISSDDLKLLQDKLDELEMRSELDIKAYSFASAIKIISPTKFSTLHVPEPDWAKVADFLENEAKSMAADTLGDYPVQLVWLKNLFGDKIFEIENKEKMRNRLVEGLATHKDVHPSIDLRWQYVHKIVLCEDPKEYNQELFNQLLEDHLNSFMFFIDDIGAEYLKVLGMDIKIDNIYGKAFIDGVKQSLSNYDDVVTTPFEDRNIYFDFLKSAAILMADKVELGKNGITLVNYPQQDIIPALPETKRF